ncbi:MAG: Rieske 2Fe-2S domain-containing protein [Xenococcaceae cyanobacterium]
MFRTSYPGNQPDLRRIGLNPNFWYPLAQSKEVKKGKAHGVLFGGEPIVLIRTEYNKVFALEDRCAHRQMPLSIGVVCGQQIKCSYHAWRYNEQGKLTGVPYLPEGAKLPISGVKSYPCKEAYGHIWVFPGEAKFAEKITFPDLPTWHSPEYKTMYFSRQVNCHYSF